MTCKECAWLWKDENDDYPRCHYEKQCPGDEAPCEYDEPYEPEDYYGDEPEYYDEPDDDMPHTLQDIRAHVLRSMDEEIRNYGDEEIIMYWLEEGVPDHDAVELDYYKEFVDDDCYHAIGDCFDECLEMMRKNFDDFLKARREKREEI